MAVIRPCSGTGPQALSTFGLQQAVALLLLALAGAGPGFATPKKPPEETGAGGWPEISAEERSLSGVPQDPATDAVLLRNDREGKIIQSADDTVNLLQYHWRLKVLKPSGKAYAEVKIPADKYSRVSNIQARTVKADGTIVPVTPDQIFEKVVRQVGDFKLTEMVFDFPAVEPGAILEYRYDRRVDFLVSITPWYFEGPVFTLRSRVKQSIPMGMGYSILCDLCQGAKPEVADFRDGKSQGQSYTMELKNLPGYRAEDFMPPAREVSPRMEMVLQAWRGHMMSELGRQDRMFVDWASIAKYADVRYQAATKPATETLKSLVAAWTQGLNDPQEKTRAILQHVRHDFRYLPYRVVYGYSRPLDAVVKSGYADNEEKAVLLQAAMKAAGIASDIALVSGKDVGSLNPKFSSFTQFSHAVVVLQSPGPLAVLDPTVSYAPPGFMPWEDSGAGALFLKGGQGEVGTLPVKGELSTTKYRITVKPRADAKAELEIEARYTGEDAIGKREDLTPASESARADYLKEWLENALPGSTLLTQALENLDNLDEPLLLKIKAEAPGLVTLAEGAAIVRGCVLFCYDTNPFTRNQREHPIYVDRGWNVEQTVTILPPEGMKPSPTPPGVSARSAVGNLTMRCATGDADDVRCSRLFVVPRNRWDASEMSGVRTMFDKVVEADGVRIAFQAGSPSGN